MSDVGGGNKGVIPFFLPTPPFLLHRKRKMWGFDCPRAKSNCKLPAKTLGIPRPTGVEEQIRKALLFTHIWFFWGKR